MEQSTQEAAQKPTFPYFFRNGGRCIKVVSETVAETIIVPPASLMAERFLSQYPTKERLKAELANFQQVPESKYKEFLYTFYLAVDAERQQANKALEPEPVPPYWQADV